MGCGANINGHDVNQVTAEEAIDIIHNSKEPVVVEVLNKVNKQQTCNNNNLSKMKSVCGGAGGERDPMVTIATQTDALTEDEIFEILDPDLAAYQYQMFALTAHSTLVEPNSRQGIAFSQAVDFGLTDLELENGIEFYDQPFDIEYREITLERASVQDKVGLTLCYENHEASEDEITDIYVSEVEANSIAATTDIREGDQILQINGVEVRSREDAIQLFSQNRAGITLLIARALYQIDDGFVDEKFDDDFRLVETQHRRDFTESYNHKGEECGTSTDTASTEKSRNDKDSGVGRTDESTKNDTSSEQDVECTSPGHNVDPDHHCSNDSFTSNESNQKMRLKSDNQDFDECNSFREALETRCSHGDSGIGGNGSLSRIDSQSSIEREIDALNKEMEQIQIECQQIYEAHRKDPQKEKVVRTDSVSSADTYRSPSRSVPRMGTRLEYIRQLTALQQESSVVDPIWVQHEQCSHLGTLHHPTSMILPLDSTMKGSSNTTPTNNPSHSASHTNVPFPNGELCNGVIKDTKDCSTSAYNTGESSRSTPLTLELTHVHNDKGVKQPLLSLSTSVKHNGGIQNGQTYTNGHHNPSDIRDIPLNSCSESVSRTSQTPEPAAVENLEELYSQYAEVMYTNQANLQHTMMVQQRLFQQKMLQQQLEQQSHESSPKHSSNNSAAETVLHASPKHPKTVPAPLNSSPKHMTLLASPGVNGSESGANNSASGVGMEWVVKRRADGTRYITRRPMRSKFLKERARKISEERSGMTTDDDAMSELKCGRYWTKEDRKRHLEKAKEYKKRKQEMLRKKMETLKETEEKKREPNILELSHKKMMKHKNKKQFDDFTTVQEMLVHGSRSGKKSVESSPSKVASSNPILSVTTV